MREYLRTKFDIENDFLTGSYVRDIKTKPLQDADFLCVLGDSERGRRQQRPSILLDAFEAALSKKYGSKAVTKHDRSVEVDFGIVADVNDNTDYRVVSMEAVPPSLAETTMKFPTDRVGHGSKRIRRSTLRKPQRLKNATTMSGRASFGWPNTGTIIMARQSSRPSY